MTSIIFDTLALANQLRAAGFTEEQATVITNAQQQAATNTLEIAKHDYHLNDVATRRDLKELEANTKRDLKEMEANTKRDLKELEASIKRDLKDLEASTKRDLKELEVGLRRDLEILRVENKKDIAETKAELIRWVVGVGLLQSSLIIGALMKMVHLI